MTHSVILSKRSLHNFTYSSFISKPIKFIFSFFAATHSLPEPANGTTNNVSSTFLDALISFSHSCNGFCVG